MGSLAILVKQMGFDVTGEDENVYPPMSTLLEKKGIKISNGYNKSNLNPLPDYIVIGNVMKRGMPIIEYILDNNIAFYSGPEFLKKFILHDKLVLAITGTHGKTTTACMLAWILQKAGKKPGFLIGGVPKNFNTSAMLSDSKYFVIEADEYDSAFFDKRSKFIHYKPNVLIINNIEYDHADIFDSINDIKKQFHHLIRIVPQNGKIIYKHDDENIQKVLDMGVWSKLESFGESSGTYSLENFQELKLKLSGNHNKLNALAAIIAAKSIGILEKDSINALKEFFGVKRRLELVGSVNNVKIIDDFAHHPTAIKATINAVSQEQNNINDDDKKNSIVNKVKDIVLKKKRNNKSRVIAVVDICSNTMRMGHHKEELIESVSNADVAFFYHNRPIDWSLADIDVSGDVDANNDNSSANKGYVNNDNKHSHIRGIFSDKNIILNKLLDEIKEYDTVLFLTNGSCDGMQTQLFDMIKDKFENI